MLVVRAVTLRSAQLPRPMAAVVVVQALALLLQARAVVAAASARKAQMRPLQGLMAVVEAEMALPSQPAPRLAVLVVALEQTLVQLHRLPYTLATEALEAEAEAALMRRTLQQVQQELAALAIWKRQVLQQVMAVQPAVHALQALRLLLADCSGKVEAVAAVVLLARAVRAVLAVAALVVEAVVQHAVHMPQALAV